MPEAHAGYAAPQARIPRTLFAHAHEDGDNNFPPVLFLSSVCMAYKLTPDNFNGLAALLLWILGMGGNENMTVNITVDIGSDGEAYNIHTQTVNGIVIAMVAGQYTVTDLTATFAVVLANIGLRDIVRVTVTHSSGDNSNEMIGIELQET